MNAFFIEEMETDTFCVKFRDHDTAKLFWSSIMAQKLDVPKYYEFIKQITKEHGQNVKEFDLKKKVAGLGDVFGQTTSPWAEPAHGWAWLGSNPFF